MFVLRQTPTLIKGGFAWERQQALKAVMADIRTGAKQFTVLGSHTSAKAGEPGKEL